MNIGLQTWGSNGDIRPMIALADGLQKAGHTASLVVSSLDNRSYADTCAQLNIRYQQIPDRIDFDLQAFARRCEKMNTLQWLKALLEESFYPYEQDTYTAAQQLVAENDLVIGHHFLYPLKLAALKQHKPYVTVTYCHAAIPCRTLAPFKFPDLGPFLNQWEWYLLKLAFDWALKKRLSRFWLKEGMPTFKHVYDSLLCSDTLNLIAEETFFCPSPQEWSELHQVTGFFNLPDYAEPWQPSPSLEAFFNAGEKPIYMTFGSVQQAVPELSMQLFIEAVERVGCRAIVVSSSNDYPIDTQQGSIFFIGRHPHAPVFQRCAAVVHHGGAGTSQTATLNGCPSIVVPFMDEQLFWGQQLYQAGLAAKPIPVKQVNAAKLAEHIKTVLSTPSMYANAQRIARDFKPERGVQRAVALIEKLQ